MLFLLVLLLAARPKPPPGPPVTITCQAYATWEGADGAVYGAPSNVVTLKVARK